MKAVTKNKLILIILFGVFLLPPLLSWYLLNYTDVPQNRDKSNNGNLIHPARPLPDAPLLDPVSGNEHTLHGKWNLVFHHRGECNEYCVNMLYKQRQLLLATGEYSLRLHRVMIVDRQDLSSIKPRLADFAGQLFLFRDSVSDNFMNTFKINTDDELVPLRRLYVVDPLGNLMMYYEEDMDPRGIIEDLRRLIKNSRIG